jgi:DNA repair exonuclease SbcCD nuclease subunit
MKIALITDTHFGARQDSHALLDKSESFFLEFFFPYLEREGIKTIIHLGDVFDRRKYVNFFTFQRCRKFFFDEIQKREIDFHIILGNHDLYFRTTNSTNSPALLLQDYNFKIYEEATYVRFEHKPFLFIPWINLENEQKAFSKIKEGLAQAVLGHLEIKGFEMLRGHLNEAGIEKEEFNKYSLVMSGHFHHRSSQGDIHYLGCPYEMTWADYGNQKGFHIFETDTLEVKFIPNPFKQFVRLEYDDMEGKAPDLLEKDLEGCYIRVVIKNKINSRLFDSFMEKLNKIPTSSVILTEEKINLASNEKIDVDIEDTLSFIGKYVDSLDTLNVDKSKLLDLVYDLYKKANELEN